MSLPDDDKEETLQIVLSDLRRLFDHISTNYNALKSRVLGLIAGLVAVVSFIFSGEGLHPSEFSDAEKIFFGVGSILLAGSFVLLLWVVATAYWEIPADIKITKKLYSRFSSKLEWLEDIKEDYENCVAYSVRKLNTRAKITNLVLVLLSIGIIILLVLKFTR